VVRVPGGLLARRPSRVPFAAGTFTSRLHNPRIAARLGLALGVCFAACFATGLFSHFAQHPLDVGFLSMPAGPAWLYRLTQGIHVAAGIAAIPLLLAKLWTVYPKLFAWPPLRGIAHGIERLTLLILVAGALFQLFSGLANTTRWYPWEFNFTVTHFWTAWIVIGALVAHVGAKLAIARAALSAPLAAVPERPGEGLGRRGFLTAAGAAAGVVTLTTLGQTLRPLKDLALLAPRRPDAGPQGVPVNRTAAGAGVTERARDPGYRLVVAGRVRRELVLSRAALAALPQHEAGIAITCVEGWSAGARWRGVPVRDLLAMAGAAPVAEVVVHSMQERGSFRSSRLNVPHAQHPDTLLALELNGEPLHVDHGYPARLISPNRPGVQQTKWVDRLEVL